MRTPSKYLSIHVETTGLCSDVTKQVTHGEEIVAIGLAVCDSNFVELAGETIFVNHAREDIGTRFHSITHSFLNAYGQERDDAALSVANFILEHFTGREDIVCMGQNVHSFTLPFLKELLYSNELYLTFSSSSLDVLSLTIPTIGPKSVRELVDLFGDADALSPEEQQVEYMVLLKCKTYIQIYNKMVKLWNSLMEN